MMMETVISSGPAGVLQAGNYSEDGMIVNTIVAMVGCGQRLDNTRRVARDEDAGRDVSAHHGARGHDRPFADRDSLEDHGAGTNPDVVAQDNRPRTFLRRRQPGQARSRVGRVAVGVEEADVCGDQAASADRDPLADRELTVVADVSVI